MKNLRIGVVGYSDKKFDITQARKYLVEAFDKIVRRYPDHTFSVVSGLTDLGIPSLAYREATSRGWQTVGIASEKAREFPLFPVDESIISGENWGDESPLFLSSIDILLKIGGGKQSEREFNTFKGPRIEYSLPLQP